jgi:hypothetical protein
MREDDIIVEVSAHAGEQPRICAWRAGQRPEDPHKTATFNWSDTFVLDDLRLSVQQIIAGIRPQIEPSLNGVEDGH